MTRNHSKCPHLGSVIQLSLPDLCKLKQGQPCSDCDTYGPNLWICLHKNCLRTGCSEQANDHSTKHFKLNQQHCIHMNLSSQRIWCYLCEMEVFLSQRRSSLVSNDSSDASRYSERIYERVNGESPETSADEEDMDRRHMNGLVGLQNIANTCYMNAALQALSNSPPLTSYFLDCGDIIEASSELIGNQRKPGLAKSYHRLIKEMWCRSKRCNGTTTSFVVPRGILYGIRNVHPMFRGFQQHDTQEFLRCFMDQLHEELKEVTPPPPDILFKTNKSNSPIENDDDQSPCSTPSPSQSEAEYETCDSGVSEQSSLSDEISMAIRHDRYSRSASPTPSQRNSTCSKTNSLSNSAGTAASMTTTSSLNSSASVAQQKDQSATKPPHRSIISDIFDGKLLSSVQCLTCDRISTREETFQDLSLPIPGKDHLVVLHQSQSMTTISQQCQTAGITCTDAVYQVGTDGWFWWLWNWLKSWFWGPAVSLHDCMAAFFSADELKGDNMYSCEKCNKLRNGIKYSRVLALPEMLCVHLKRFRHDLSYSSKISSPVHFPLTGLDMRQYLHKDCHSQISTYDLTAVICHHGTVGGGHYTSFAKHDLTGKWFEFDDQVVTEVTPDVVQNCQAYVLFYRKSNPQMDIIRAKALELAETNPPQAADIRFFVSRQWINRFHTFAEPGPIDNWALLCPHGGLPPCKAALVSQLAVPLPQPLWDYLYKKFGGGPACNRLFECDTCRIAAEKLCRRQKAELEAFTQYNEEFQYQESPTIYAISMAWLRQWQLFARGFTTEEPGPINNNSIAPKTDVTPLRTVRPGSDYAQINAALWKFFYGIYGGGPEIILRGVPTEEIRTQKEKEVEHMEIDQDTVTITTSSDVSEADTGIHSAKVDSIEMNGTRDVEVKPRPPINNTSTATPNAITKTTKNVSFEDEADVVVGTNHEHLVNGIKSEPEDATHKTSTAASCIAVSSNNSSQIIPEFVIPILKRMKPTNPLPTVAATVHNSNGVHEISGRKARRYRMKSNAYFGPEGKYINNSSQSNIPPDTSVISTSPNPNPNPIPNPNLQTTTTTTTNATMKNTSSDNYSSTNYTVTTQPLQQLPSESPSNSRVTEEVTPLLQATTENHQQTKNPTSASQQQTPPIVSETVVPETTSQKISKKGESHSIGTSNRKSSKNSHRKKFKSKRTVVYNAAQENGSDSG